MKHPVIVLIFAKGVGEPLIFDIKRVIEHLKSRRRIFVSEADFQLELGWSIKELYPDSKVRMEYCPEFDRKMYIDILVVLDGRWIPIELKYKTKFYEKTVDGDKYYLKNHGAKDVNCYLYLYDMQRIEMIKEYATEFIEGYTIFLTNELSYTKPPMKKDCVYRDFSLEHGIVKTGEMKWADNTGAGTMRSIENPIILKNEYEIDWKEYSIIDESKAGTFKILINKIA